MSGVDEEIRALQSARQGLAKGANGDGKEADEERAPLNKIAFDQDLYTTDRFKGFSTELVEEDEDAGGSGGGGGRGGGGRGAGVSSREGMHPSTRAAYQQRERDLEALGEDGSDRELLRSLRETEGSGLQDTVIANRESDYHKRARAVRQLSPSRGDMLSDQTPMRSYGKVLEQQQLANEREELLRRIEKQKKDAEDKAQAEALAAEAKAAEAAAAEAEAAEFGGGAGAAGAAKKRKRWDDGSGGAGGGGGAAVGTSAADWDLSDATPSMTLSDATPGAGGGGGGRNRWDVETPMRGGAVSDATPTPGGTGRRNRWGETPKAVDASDATPGPSGMSGVTPTPSGRAKKNRWDQTPLTSSGQVAVGATPLIGATPLVGATPVGSALAQFGQTPAPGAVGGLYGPGSASATPEQEQRLKWERELEERNRFLTDEELEEVFKLVSGFKVLEPPTNYQPDRTGRGVFATPTPMTAGGGFQIQSTPAREEYGIPATPGESNLPFIAPEDEKYFKDLLEAVDEENLPAEEVKKRRIMRLLLKIKKGTPPQRKTALRQITDKAREFGAEALFDQILPLLMSPTLEDQERHLLVKVIDRILYKLDDLIRPYVHKILVVIEPLLIDEDYYARVEGREIISNLAKAAGLATMIATMRPDIDNLDEYVRNTTARAFAVVASALGIPSLLPFLKAVCLSKKSWQARHTGIKIIQQVAILMGCAVLPHLRQMVEIIEHGLVDENQKVRTITALALAALAEAAFPYGIESFDSVLRPLWKGIRQHRGKGLAAFLKAIGFIIPLMDANYANYYTKEVMVILIREFTSPDEEMKKIVLKVVKQCVATEGVPVPYVKEDVLPPFFQNFWTQRLAMDRRNYRQVVETTVELANKVGVAEIVGRIVDDLKDTKEDYRRMVMETIEKVITNLGAADVDPRLEERLLDGLLYAFQEQVNEETSVMLNGFGTVINALGTRCKPYLQQIAFTIKFRLNNKNAKVRMQAADLIGRIAVVMKQCGEDQIMGHLGQVLFEYLGEEYPEVLGSILGALKAIVNVIGMNKMTPPIKELLPRLTPILKNRHEKVQENCIDLVGRIADRGAEHVPSKEWMRICFELLEMLKAHKKAIRRAAVNTFGYIAKAVGPSEVLHTLLRNLRVQERQNRVCTTVAIAIVAETCNPFTVLPALMNEYRVPELNVQNGVLKALSFMFEYIGEMAKDYIYAVVPLLEDALMDRDLVHRQTAATTVKHLALGCAGLGCEDALVHLLNLVWPNIFEISPHVINAVFEAVGGLVVALGPTKVFHYVLQGLFHPARKVREVYWKVYNTLYIFGTDALTPAYPRIEDEGPHTFRRTTLELFI